MSFGTGSRRIVTEMWPATLFTVVPFVCLAVPMYVIRPFRPQGAEALRAALAIRAWGPWISFVAAVIVVGVTMRVWTRSKRLLPRGISLALCLMVVAGGVLTTINLFEVMFHPYPSPAFIEQGAAQLDADDRVIAVRMQDEARAYPVRTMGYHHIVNDIVGGEPVAVTYCTLCHTGLVWSRKLNGTTLHFHLAGINNGNALLRDEETGSIWQQSTGEAIFGPWKGQHLRLIHSDELSFALWRAEQPTGLVLKPETQYVSEYDPKDWEKHVEKTHTVIDTSKSGVGPHELMLGVNLPAGAKAYPMRSILAARLIQDRVGEVPLVIVVGHDGTSVRIFNGMVGTNPGTFTVAAGAVTTAQDGVMRDAETGSDWSFEGCAVAGRLAGQCLEPLDGNKDYWFDWLNHHPETRLYRG